jgi:hypothetical protein
MGEQSALAKALDVAAHERESPSLISPFSAILGMIAMFSFVGFVAFVKFGRQNLDDARRPRYLEVAEASDEEPLMSTRPDVWSDGEGPVE